MARSQALACALRSVRAAAALTSFPADTAKRAVIAAGDLWHVMQTSSTAYELKHVTALQVKFLSTVLEGLMPKDRSDRKTSPAKGVTAADVESKEEFFQGLGNIAEAPKYLRINGKVNEGARWLACTAV
jgi:hypothetical protein